MKQESDGWKGARTLPIGKALELAERYAAKDHENTKPYRLAQRMAMQHVAMMARVCRS